MKTSLPPNELEMQIGGMRGILKQCPFCGYSPIMGSSVNDQPKYGRAPVYQAVIGCANLDCGVQMFCNTNSREESQLRVMKQWNTRI